MNEKLSKKIQAAEDDVAEEILDNRLEQHREDGVKRAMFVLGGTHIAGKISAALNAEAMRTLILFQESKMHEDLGYETFVDFLEQSEFAPMSKSQFYERKAILEKEGDIVFDLLTNLGIPVKKRKLLGKGNVEISGETAIIHTDGGDDIEIELTDRTRLLETLSALADANAEKSIKLQRQTEKIDKHDDKVRELYEENDRIRASKIAEVAGNPHMIARVEFNLAASKLADAARNLSAIEKDQFRDAVLEDHAAARAQLTAAYSTGSGGRSPHDSKGTSSLQGETLAESLDQFLGEVDLDPSDDNDGELAAKL